MLRYHVPPSTDHSPTHFIRSFGLTLGGCSPYVLEPVNRSYRYLNTVNNLIINCQLVVHGFESPILHQGPLKQKNW